MHSFRHIEESLFTPPAGYEGRCEGFRRADLVGREQGSVHMGFYISELQPGGHRALAGEPERYRRPRRLGRYPRRPERLTAFTMCLK